MKKILLGTAVALALFTGCTEEKKPATETTVTQEVKKDEVAPTTPVQTEATEEKKEETK